MMIYHCSRLYRKYIIIIFVEAVVMFVWAMGRGSWSWGNILTRNQRVFSMLLHLSELWLGRKCGQNHQLKYGRIRCRLSEPRSQGALPMSYINKTLAVTFPLPQPANKSEYPPLHLSQAVMNETQHSGPQTGVRLL